METVSFNYECYLSGKCKSTISSFLREILDSAETSGLISFAGGLPNPDLFPVHQLGEALAKTMTNNAKATLQYSGSQGYLPLREWIADRYFTRFGMNIDPGIILITNGSQQALDLVGKLFLNEQDIIFLEKPSYIGAIQAFSAYNVIMKQISLEADGIAVSELAEALKYMTPKFLYCIPNYQNPSGITYAAEKRTELAEILESEKIILVEDDPYGEIYFAGETNRPVYSLIPDQCILTGSFSKMISPGIRTGWIVVNKNLKPYLLKAKQAADLHTNNLVQQMIFRFLTDNSIDEHLETIRNSYRKQKETMIMQARIHLPKGTIFTDPQGGMFLWACLPGEYDTSELVSFALREKVLFVPGKPFFTNGEGGQCMRLNFTCSSEKKTKEGMQRMKTALVRYMECKAVPSIRPL